MTKKKPTTVKEWEKVCENLNAALKLSIKTEEDLTEQIRVLNKKLNTHIQNADAFKEEIENLESYIKEWEEEHENEIEQLEEQLTMSVGVIKYLEMKLGRTNSV